MERLEGKRPSRTDVPPKRREAKRPEPKPERPPVAAIAALPPTARPRTLAQEIVDVDDFSQLADARRNYLAVVEAMEVAVPREVAALSKRRQELMALIDELSSVGEVSLADQLAEIRARRSAGA